jgi:hypothetical protein
MVGAAGSAIIFICTLVACVLLVLWTLALTGHFYLVVVQDTSAGTDRVVWPDEPFYDWVVRAACLTWLAAFWLVPAGLLSRALATVFLPAHPGLRVLLLAVPGLWLFFPLAVLSSLGARSPWIPFRPQVIGQVLRVFPSTLVFYLMTGILLLGLAGLWYVSVFTARAGVLPVAAAAAGAVVLIHGRLLGRLAWLIQRHSPARPAPADSESPAAGRARRKPRRSPPKPAKARRGRTVEAQDPWAVPEEEEQPVRESTPLEEGYGVVHEGVVVPDFHSRPLDDPGVKLPVGRFEESVEVPEETYDLASERPAGQPPDGLKTTPPPPKPASVLADVTGRERDLLHRHTDPPPRSPLFSGVYLFPWSGDNLKAWLWLSMSALATGAAFRGLLASSPF